jgi:hypothetical protein
VTQTMQFGRSSAGGDDEGSSTIENGFVHLPEKAEWLATYLHELVTFPKGKYDDQADSTSQALDWAKQRFFGHTTAIFNGLTGERIS